MKCLKNIQFLLIGIVIGGVMFGGFTAYAAGITAYNKTATIMIDGEIVDLKGYLIEGTHYFQLRELDALLKKSGKDFAIVWDGTNNRVLIDTSRGYVPDESFKTPVIIVPESAQVTDLASATTVTTTTTAEPKINIDEMKAEFVRLTNEERVRAGASELKILPELMECAQLKADDMLDNGYFGHISPKYGSPLNIPMDLSQPIRCVEPYNPNQRARL